MRNSEQFEADGMGSGIDGRPNVVSMVLGELPRKGVTDQMDACIPLILGQSYESESYVTGNYGPSPQEGCMNRSIRFGDLLIKAETGVVRTFTNGKRQTSGFMIVDQSAR